jgi:hypothetical protein
MVKDAWRDGCERAQAEQRSDMKTSTAQDYPEPEYKSLDERRAQGKAPREALLGEVHRHLKPAKDRRDTKIRTVWMFTTAGQPWPTTSEYPWTVTP